MEGEWKAWGDRAGRVGFYLGSGLIAFENPVVRRHRALGPDRKSTSGSGAKSSWASFTYLKRSRALSRSACSVEMFMLTPQIVLHTVTWLVPRVPSPGPRLWIVRITWNGLSISRPDRAYGTCVRRKRQHRPWRLL